MTDATAAPVRVRIPSRTPILAWAALVVVLLYITAAVFAPLIAPYGEAEIVSREPFGPWSERFLLGTDQLGRDLLSRLIFGARNTLGIALVTTLLAFAIGVSLGTTAALARGWLDQVVSRAVDILMAIPQLVFALVLLTIFGTSIPNLILIMAVLDSTRAYRLTRAVAMNVVVLDFVEAAELRGESRLWILAREILPNIMPTLVAEFGLRFCFVFLTIAALSFLGVGIQPPVADWGSMVRENATLITYGDPTPLLPAAAIAVLTVSINVLVDWYVSRTSSPNARS
jgi:peptide/nickel transport system permease protein